MQERMKTIKLLREFAEEIDKFTDSRIREKKATNRINREE